MFSSLFPVRADNSEDSDGHINVSVLRRRQGAKRRFEYISNIPLSVYMRRFQCVHRGARGNRSRLNSLVPIARTTSPSSKKAGLGDMDQAHRLSTPHRLLRNSEEKRDRTESRSSSSHYPSAKTLARLYILVKTIILKQPLLSRTSNLYSHRQLDNSYGIHEPTPFKVNKKISRRKPQAARDVFLTTRGCHVISMDPLISTSR